MRRARLAVRSILAVAILAPLVPSPSVATVAADDAPWTTPTVPPRCTTTQVDSGDVAGCVVYGGRGRPDEQGWPSPPFPESTDGTWPPPGWVFDGWSFTGSPALAGWEARMVSNPTALGRIGIGRIRLLPEAMLLFDGFLREISARGYVLRDGIGYNYRCTITSATNSCQGLTRSSLSFHAYGLAIDINGAQNPPRTYAGIDGATACATPMITDMPQWLVQTAEKWGLYWGGYGWSSGCASPTTARTTVYRDPTHFEFRGTPQQALAIAAHNGAATNCYDVVDPAGTPSTRCSIPGAIPPAGTRTVVDTDAPQGAVSALVNLVATDTRAAGYVTAESCGPAPAGVRQWANLNQRVGSTVANLAVVGLDPSGRFCLFQSSATHLVVDVQGYFVPAALAPTGSVYRPITPVRALDTRSDVLPPESGPARIPADGEVVVPSALPEATAVLANLAVTQAGGDGYVTADRCQLLGPGPQRNANVNYGPGLTVANLAVVGSDADVDGDGGSAAAGFCAYSSQAVHLIADVVGWFGAAGPGGTGFAPMTPERLVDTRGCRLVDGVTRCGSRVAANSIVRLQAPAGAASVLANLVLIEPGADGYATAGPCSTMVAGPQPTANINAAPKAVVANLAIVPVDADGSFCVYTSGDTHLVVDVQGSFSADADLRLVVPAPTRALDTRG